MTEPGSQIAALQRHSEEQQRAFVLSHLRSYGPAFGHELASHCLTTNPAARVAELNAEGYRIETLRSYRRLPDGSDGWAMLYVLRVKCIKTGAEITAPVPFGAGPVLERWNS
ncbi:helix-turn-helix domain-containing protein [Hydrogenophaga bisanensis]|uniref:Helix-turn-helix domain-containing protein n=1 Tax=Hydrogenophaga bisanensis TaxID=439611 RepID=A0ABW2R688_9BURK